MSFNLRNRSFLKELDFTPDEWRFLLHLAAELKTAKYTGTEQPRLRGKNIALIFEKTSTRTRSAFEVASFDQGGHVTYLDPSGSQLGHKESIADTAQVLGRMYDAIEYRGNAQTDVETLAEHAGGVLHRLLVADLRAAGPEGGDVCTLVLRRHLEGRAGPGRGLLEDQRDVLAGQVRALVAAVLRCLQVR